jgi:hypothetical protein
MARYKLFLGNMLPSCLFNVTMETKLTLHGGTLRIPNAVAKATLKLTQVAKNQFGFATAIL